jgi:trk system potassium uptake protein TrkH
MESTSGFTTTGISTIRHPEILPDSFSFYRSYTEWVGGLSFIYLIVALYYPETKLAGMKNVLGSGILRFRQLLSTICIIFTVYTVIIALLIFFLRHINILDSISLAFTTFTTGGFVPTATALTVENPIPLIVIIGWNDTCSIAFCISFWYFQ